MPSRPKRPRDPNQLAKIPARAPPPSDATARRHKTLRVTPAMEAGISNHVWSLEEIAGLAS